ncbi:hypothetical protein [Roseibium sp. RKSG952]|uniref:hypothetical protein n=1 Tax=Roseibium sp. RKSG952 TaxID=2529384 RepID=UPI0012BC86E1|nr:hypothetical protein [Roseibium sp. RKSG952]MTH97011.1 hypothetical protein [Roseibium sp. RKSG952]
MEPRVFAFWTGTNEMSEERKACLESLRNTGLDVVLVTPDTLDNWILANHPLHAAYDCLSEVHKSDYLRAYFMHHYGGGYSDVKRTTQSWEQAFRKLGETEDAYAIGYQEVSPKGVAHIHRHKIAGDYYLLSEKTGKITNYLHYRILRLKWKILIGNGCYIFRPQTKFTHFWISNVENRLSILQPLLIQNPARSPRDALNCSSNASEQLYPLPWSGICADIFHPLVYRHRDRILQGLPTPSFKNYL